MTTKTNIGFTLVRKNPKKSYCDLYAVTINGKWSKCDKLRTRTGAEHFAQTLVGMPGCQDSIYIGEHH